MSDFEHELLDVLEKDVKFDPAREEVLRLQITSEFKKKKRRLVIWSVVYHVIGVAFVLPGLSQVLHSTDQLEAIRGLALVILGAILLIVIKLWYWIGGELSLSRHPPGKGSHQLSHRRVPAVRVRRASTSGSQLEQGQTQGA